MGIFDKLFGKQEKEGQTKGLEERMSVSQFAERAVQGPVVCRINILDIEELWRELIDKLKTTGLSSSGAIKLVDDKLLGVYPKCATYTGALGYVAAFMQAGGGVIIGGSKGVERLAEGHCRNYGCSLTGILIFWRPDEDEKARKRLRKMGIPIRRTSMADYSMVKYERFDQEVSLPKKPKR